MHSTLNRDKAGSIPTSATDVEGMQMIAEGHMPDSNCVSSTTVVSIGEMTEQD